MKSIVYITSRRLFPLDSGDKILTLNILKRLSKIYNVHLFNLNDGEVYSNEEMTLIKEFATSFQTKQFKNEHSILKKLKSIVLNQVYAKVKLYDKELHGAISDFLDRHQDADFVVWDHLRSTLFYGPNNFKNILIEHNNEANAITGRAKGLKNPLSQYLINQQVRLKKEYIKNMHKRMDRIISLNQNDFYEYAESEPEKYALMDRLLINFEHMPYELKSDTDAINLLFVGSLDWYPNIDAIEWFLHEVMPLLKNSKMYHLHIVGRDPGKTMIQKIDTYSNVTLHSNVPSIEEYYLNTDVVILPIRSGSGINIKVLESLSYGVPMVMTDFAKRGYDGLDFINSADDPLSFAKEVEKLSDIENRKIPHLEELKYYAEYQKDIERTLRRIFTV